MPPLRRHQLARLRPEAWDEILAQPWDAQAHDCLRHWAARHLPLVVTRQDQARRRAGHVALGLAAPLAWHRRRIALHVRRAAIAGFDEFPPASDLLRRLDGGGRDAFAARFPAHFPAHFAADSTAPLAALLARLDVHHVQPRVYGSHGWQLLTGERYVHAASDIDLWIAVDDAAAADAVAHCLACDVIARPRLDGELVFPDGRAVAWREWAAWRNGRTRGLLVKRLDGVEIEAHPGACAAVAG